ncbi:SRPBCC family protein [Hellea balneolensis]|uniref:SRPBCC family protein n=1 Tax=Hellea balneolensis TaxID=287478 RepID=UPI00138AD318|nr:SRPBCC domain-containing protein [Hellea balneolensis]
MTRLLTMFCLWAALMIAASAEAQLRPMVYTDKTVQGGIEEVWTDWTTAEGLESFLAPKAIVEGKLGGAYEVWFLPDAPKGQRGAEDGVLLGWQKDSPDGSRMIQFTWKMPPYMPAINESMTVVQLWMIPAGETKTRLRLFHTGFGDTAEWREAELYFEKAWPQILGTYAKHLSETD